MPSQAMAAAPATTTWSTATSLKVAAELDGVLEYLEDPTAEISGMAEVAWSSIENQVSGRIWRSPRTGTPSCRSHRPISGPAPWPCRPMGCE